MKVCAVPNCDRPVKGLGYCNAHYIRLKRHGSPEGGKSIMHGEPMRFVRDVVLKHDSDECLIWPYYRNADGYGQVRYEGRDRGAHRVSCILAHGEPPTSEHEAAHSCGNGHLGCVSPGHLRWATMLENEQDKLSHGRLATGSAHHCAKLTDSDVATIKSLKGKIPQADIASMFGVSVKTVYRATNDNLWPASQERMAA